MMENMTEIFVATLVLGGIIALLGLRRLHSPAVTPENRAETALGLFTYFMEADGLKLVDGKVEPGGGE